MNCKDCDIYIERQKEIWKPGKKKYKKWRNKEISGSSIYVEGET
jgi:hypothetical protein